MSPKFLSYFFLISCTRLNKWMWFQDTNVTLPFFFGLFMLTDQLNLMSSWNSSLQDRGMAEMYTMKLSKYVRGSEWYIVCNCSEKFAIIANVTIQFTLSLPFLSDSQGRNSEILFWLMHSMQLMGVKKTFNKCWIVICGISCFSLPFLWLDLL